VNGSHTFTVSDGDDKFAPKMVMLTPPSGGQLFTPAPLTWHGVSGARIVSS
jgi:hypothetical protein